MEKLKDDEDVEELSEAKWQLLTTSFKISKPLDKIKAIRDLIVKVDPDICLFTEVGGAESLENFNTHFLKNSYKVIHKDTNSDRGIDMGMLIKPHLEPKSKFKIHKQKVFARGVLELRVDVNNKSLHFLLTHLKSKLNFKGKDFEGRSQRELEVLKMIDIVENIHSNKNSQAIVTGDLNGIIDNEDTEPELAHFANKLRLLDVLTYLKHPNFDRSTYIYYNKQGDDILMQLDYILIPQDIKKYVNSNSKVLDFCGNRRTNFPKNLKEKRTHPSDHYPLYLELDLDKFFN
jgi:endonuclease/exonuclease/phosphatase family metal-dependent hydrolase